MSLFKKRSSEWYKIVFESRDQYVIVILKEWDSDFYGGYYLTKSQVEIPIHASDFDERVEIAVSEFQLDIQDYKAAAQKAAELNKGVQDA